MPSIINGSNLATLQTATEVMWQDAWNGYGGPYLQDFFCMEMATDAKYVNESLVASTPGLAEWLDEKEHYTPRAYTKTHTIRKFYKAMAVDRMDLDSRGGAETVGAAIKRFIGNPKRDLQKQLVTDFLANTWTSIDGVSLGNTAHPHTSSTGNNLTTAAFAGTATVDAAFQAMQGYKDEDGNLLDMTPTDFVCGPSLQVQAFDAFAVVRPLSVSNAGAYGGTSNVVGAVTVPNVFEGSLRVHICPEITGSQYAFIDNSKPTLKPFVRYVKRELMAVTQFNMEDEARYNHDQYRVSVEGDYCFGPGSWHTIWMKRN